MDKIFTGPGKVTIELTPPKKNPPFWPKLLRFALFYFVIIGALKLLSLIL